MSDDDRYRRFNLRIPKDTFARLQKDADGRSHSMNAEILRRLDIGFSIDEDDIGKLSEWAYSGRQKELDTFGKIAEKLIKSLEMATKAIERTKQK